MQCTVSAMSIQQLVDGLTKVLLLIHSRDVVSIMKQAATELAPF
jgi:hypothetical protein